MPKGVKSIRARRSCEPGDGINLQQRTGKEWCASSSGIDPTRGAEEEGGSGMYMSVWRVGMEYVWDEMDEARKE